MKIAGKRGESCGELSGHRGRRRGLEMPRMRKTTGQEERTQELCVCGEHGRHRAQPRREQGRGAAASADEEDEDAAAVKTRRGRYPFVVGYLAPGLCRAIVRVVSGATALNGTEVVAAGSCSCSFPLFLSSLSLRSCSSSFPTSATITNDLP